MIRRIVPAVVLLAFLAACAATREAAPARASLDELLGHLNGDFSSRAQAERDHAYFEVLLSMRPIWSERSDGPWLYVEQAIAGSEDKPYRQRIYHLRAEADSVVSEVYELPGDALRFVGAQRDPAKLASLDPAQLLPRIGCELRLQRHDDGSYVGRTGERSCSSDLRGASYATSEAVIVADRFHSWDRGFDATGKQVWGAAAGPYEFVKQQR
ncbi:MAG: chromophore lyase CpcT/CpeT [Xanthomonadales bacterium]|nr:chromophore lyase CpcT/CpeT [Xanthomonadales bacterium]